MPEKGICHLQSPQTLVREPRLLGKHRNDLNYRDANVIPTNPAYHNSQSRLTTCHLHKGILPKGEHSYIPSVNCQADF